MFNAFISNRATTRCPICLLTWKDYKDIQFLNFDHSCKKIRNKFQYGLSQLHFKLNCFDFLLKISHKLHLDRKQIELGRALTRQEKDLAITEFRNQYQIDFGKKLKLKIDYVEPGYGRTNTGNNVSSCLEKFEITGEILGINSHLVENFNKIIKFLYSTSTIVIKDYIELLNKTHKLIRDSYPNIAILAILGHYCSGL